MWISVKRARVKRARVKRASGDKLRAVLFLSIAMDTLCYDLSG